ncbi:ABC transporter ATP-binding protein [Aliiroseovarius sp. PrR006]|uniref:ATP-binding cassette domain-containing protein n=1 Tax=Aliiroseovarius sp. PrR006 TaxID=2706883 RepID=UPI0013D5CD3F|nr:ATP-binding cassette domain-containing protein [Aliiroseovarius sp. PrR006]
MIGPNGAGKTSPIRYACAVLQKPTRAQAETAGTQVGLGPMLAHPATFLPGGERQKLAIARAIITAPALLFLGEPCASLDGRATREIEEILQHAAAPGTCLIMSTHDMGKRAGWPMT